MIPRRSSPVDGEADARSARFAFAARLRVSPQALRRSPAAAAVTVVILAVVLVAGLSYFGAGTFNKRAADTRAANEASSFAQHSSTLATGDAFAGYIQILRDAEDPVVRGRDSSHDDRVSALQQLLYLNVNRFDSLTIAERSGLVLATTDPSIVSVRESPTFAETRANLSPANSDIILPVIGKNGYVEYTAALREPDGANWAILVARADPGRLWTATLGAAVDGSRNVIINNEGRFAAGVPEPFLGQPWTGSAVGSSGVRATIDGTDSICGLAPIGKDTQIDRGLNVASCLPASVIRVEHGQAMGKQGLVTLAGAVLAIVIAAGMLKLALAGAPARVSGTLDAPTEEPENVDEARLANMAADPDDDDPLLSLITGAGTAGAADVTGSPAPPPTPADVDAISLIDAYEQRNARLAERIRESVEAKLLLAATQADEAYKLQGTDDELSVSLHGRAMEELERLRERELRAIGQELYPSLTRLGLPSALRGLARDFADLIEITLDLDAAADAVSPGNGRTPIAAGLRLALYRFAQETALAFALAGASTCLIALRRESASLRLSVAATPRDEVDASLLDAVTLSVEAYAGRVAMEDDRGRTTLSADVPAPFVAPDDRSDEADPDDAEDDPDDEADAFDDAFQAPKPAILTTASPRDNLDVSELISAVERVREEYAGRVELRFEHDVIEGAPALAPALHKSVVGLVTSTLTSIDAMGAPRADASLRVTAGELALEISADGDAAVFDVTPLRDYEFGIEAFEGTVSVARGGSRIAVLATVAVPAGDGIVDGTDTA